MATTALREQLVGLYTGQALFAALHSGDPGTTGANQIAAVPRQALTWTAGAVDGQATAAAVTFDVPAGTNVTHVGIWSAATGGTFLDATAAAVSFASAGKYTTTLTYVQS